MGGFSDLRYRAQPALWGGGVTISPTEGADWRWVSSVFLDDAGYPIDFSVVTGDCKAYTQFQGTLVVTLDFEGFAGGYFAIGKAAADTGGLALGIKNGRNCPFYLTMTNGVHVVQGWGISKSKLVILPAVA